MERSIALLKLMFLVIFLESCITESGEIFDLYPDYQTKIQGKWSPVEAIIKGVAYPYEGHEECYRDYWEFTVDNTLREVNIIDCLENLNGEERYNIDENILTIGYGAIESYEVVIENLEDSTLVLLFQDYQFGNGSTEEIRMSYLRE